MVDTTGFPYEAAVRVLLAEISAGTGQGGQLALESTLQSVLSQDTTANATLSDIRTAVQSTTPVGVFALSADNETVAASQTAQILGATGAVGDRLDFLLVVPATTSPGNVLLKDGNGSDITLFAGGASSVLSLIPFAIPWGKTCVNETTPGWKVTTGANVSVVGFGDFT